MTEALSVVLQMDEALHRQLKVDEAITAMLEHYVIDSKETADVVNADMRQAIIRVAEIKKIKAGFVAPAKQIIANAEALFDPAIEAQEAFGLGLRKKLEVYTFEQRRIADEARRVAEEAERKRRQEAEAKAAAERAKAAQEAQEQRRQAQIAENERQAALAAGNAQAAAVAAAEAARLKEQAQATVETAEIKAQETVLAAAAQNTVVVAPEKVEGFSLVANWGAELAEGKTEADFIREAARAMVGVRVVDGLRELIPERPDLAPLFQRDGSASNKLAKALKGAMSVPCLIAVNRPSSRSRAA